MQTKRENLIEIDHLSFSSISTYKRCGKQFEFRYVKGLKELPKIALIEGSAHHKAFEENNKQKMEKGLDMRASQLSDIFMENLRASTQGVGDVWESEDEDMLYSRAKDWHSEYINRIAPNIHPTGVEERFEKELKNGKESVNLVGIVDLLQKGKSSDYKTTSAYGFTSKKKAIDSDIQLTFYSWLAGTKNVEQICLVKKANPEVGILTSTRSQKQIDWALMVAKDAFFGIRAGYYPRTDPANWYCSELYCGFWRLCRGK